MPNNQICVWLDEESRLRLAEEARALGLGLAGYSRLLIKIGHQRLYDFDSSDIAGAMKDDKFL